MQNKRLFTTIGYFAAFVAIGLSTAALGPTLPALAEHTHSQLGQASLLFSTHALGYLLGSFLGGRLYDRVAAHNVLVSALLIMAAMLVIAPLVPAFWTLAVVFLVLGSAEGAVDVGGNTLLVWVHGRDVGPFMNGLHFFFGTGSFLSPIIVGAVLSLIGGIAWAYWFLALLLLPTAAWLARLPSPHIGTTEDKVNDRNPGTRSQARNRRLILVVLIALFLLLYVGAEAGCGGWIYSYAVALGLATETSAAYLTSAFWGALTIGRLLGIPTAAKFRPKSILLADLLGCLVSVGILVLWPHSSSATWIGILSLGLSMATIFPIVISLAGQEIILTGRITGWFLVGASLGGMTLPWIMGQLFESAGPRSVMVAVLADLVLALGLFGALLLYSSRQTAEATGSA